MLKRLILMSSSFTILSSAGPEPAATAQVEGCLVAGSVCSSGTQCCSNICFYYESLSTSCCRDGN